MLAGFLSGGTFAALAAALLGSALPGAAQTIVAEWKPVQETGWTAGGPSSWGQTFKSTGGGKLSTITVRAYAGSPAPPTLYFDFHNISNAVVVVPPVATVAVSTAPLQTGAQWLTASFASASVILRANTQYAFTVRYDYSGGQYLSYPSAPGYPDGAMLSSYQGGPFSPHSSNSDMLFEVTIAPPTVRPLEVYAAVEVLMATDTDKLYQLQYATNLPTTNWMNLGAAFFGYGTTNTWLESTRQSPRRFYRLLQLN